MQVGISIQTGKVLPSMLLQKLGIYGVRQRFLRNPNLKRYKYGHERVIAI